MSFTSVYYLNMREKILPREAEPIIMNGPKQVKSNNTGNSKLPRTAPILPTIIVRLTAIVLKKNIE